MSAPRTLRVASAEDRDDVIATVVTAFARDPAFRYFFPDDTLYERQARAFVGYLFDKRVGYGTIWVTSDGNAAALWSPPKSVTAECSDRDSALRTEMCAAVGADATARLDAYDMLVDAALPASREFWYLGILATRPSGRGKGRGRELLQLGVAHARSRQGEAYLETTNRANVGYYQANGWSLVASIDTATPSTIFVLRADDRADCTT